MLTVYEKFVPEFVSINHSCNVADIKKKTFDLGTVTAEGKVKCTLVYLWYLCCMNLYYTLEKPFPEF
jgi:hypothetical protein